MASAYPNYEEEDPEIREIEERLRPIHISSPEDTQMEIEDSGITEEALGGKLMPICALVDELVKFYEERRWQHDEIIRRGRALEEIMLSHQENLIRENEFLFLLKIGQVYSIIKKDKELAMEVLSKVVEHDPNVAEAWDALAVCYWDLQDSEKAQFCLENSLRQGRRKVPLRNMSVVCRKFATKYPDRKLNLLEEGINLAKEAVEKDFKDGISWGVLGNAYLSAHLKLMKDRDYANLALSAYKEAVNMGTTFNAELYFHQGYVHAFCENYKEALMSLDNAIALDTDKQEHFVLKNELFSFLKNVMYLQSCHGNLDPTCLAKHLKDIQNYQIAKSLKAESSSVGSSQFGEDHRMFVYGKVIWTAPKANYLPDACGCIDANGEVFVITIYNLPQGKQFIVGDTITISKSDFKIITFEYNNQLFEFRSLRVDNPAELLVNLERLT